MDLLESPKKLAKNRQKNRQKIKKSEKKSPKIVKKSSEMRCARAFRDRGCDPELFIKLIKFIFKLLKIYL